MTRPEPAATAPIELVEGFMRALFTDIIANLARSQRAQDLTVNDVAALYLLDRAGELRIGELAVALAAPMPAASRVASGLVDRGLVSRREDPADRRVRVLSLSTRGRAFIERTSRERAATAVSVLAGMPGDSFASIASAMGRLVGTRRAAPTKDEPK